MWVVVAVVVGGGGCGCGFVGSGRDETVRSFSKCLRERERACGRLAKNEKALKLKRDKKKQWENFRSGGEM